MFTFYIAGKLIFFKKTYLTLMKELNMKNKFSYKGKTFIFNFVVVGRQKIQTFEIFKNSKVTLKIVPMPPL